MTITLDGTTGISSVDASASSPSIRGADANSGIFYGADFIKFSTGGVERLAISNSGVSGTGVGGLFSSYAQVSHKENGGTNGGDLTNGAWRTRTLNTEDFDADGITSLSSNQFTLQAGTYFIEAFTTQYRTDLTSSRIYNATDSSVVSEGLGVHSSSGQNLQAAGYVSGTVTISGTKAFEIQSRCQTSKTSNGAGISDSGFSNTKETYVICKIYKEA